MANHKADEMDVAGHERTFGGFVKFMTWGAGIAILLLTLLALANA